MSDQFKTLLGQIREAYAQLQTGALQASGWKREGASSYTVHKARPDREPEPAKTRRTADAAADAGPKTALRKDE